MQTLVIDYCAGKVTYGIQACPSDVVLEQSCIVMLVGRVPAELSREVSRHQEAGQLANLPYLVVDQTCSTGLCSGLYAGKYSNVIQGTARSFMAFAALRVAAQSVPDHDHLVVQLTMQVD